MGKNKNKGNNQRGGQQGQQASRIEDQGTAHPRTMNNNRSHSPSHSSFISKTPALGPFLTSYQHHQKDQQSHQQSGSSRRAPHHDQFSPPSDHFQRKVEFLMNKNRGGPSDLMAYDGTWMIGKPYEDLRSANHWHARQRRSEICAATFAATQLGGVRGIARGRLHDGRGQLHDGDEIRLDVPRMLNRVAIADEAGVRFLSAGDDDVDAAEDHKVFVKDSVSADHGEDGAGQTRPIEILRSEPSETVSDLAIERGETEMEMLSTGENFYPVVGIVNAANAWTPGGGFITGGRHALEEALCCQSTLYAGLKKGADLVREVLYCLAGG